MLWVLVALSLGFRGLGFRGLGFRPALRQEASGRSSAGDQRSGKPPALSFTGEASDLQSETLNSENPIPLDSGIHSKSC